MSAILFLLVSLFLGYSLVRFLGIKLLMIEHLAIGLGLGLFFMSWIALLLSQISMDVGLWFSIPVGLLVGYLLLNYNREKISIDKSVKRKSLFLFYLTIIFFTVLLFILLYKRSLYPMADGGWETGSNSWGDLALHMSLVSRFATIDKFDWAFPIYKSGNLTYPFLIDFMTGLLVRGGFSERVALIVPSLVYIFSCMVMIISIGRIYFQKVSVGALTLFMYIFNGSVAGGYYFVTDLLSHDSIIKSYGNYTDKNLHFSNVVTDLFIPQRGYPLGIFIVLFALLALKFKNKRTTLLMALSVGLLPFAHTHSYFIILGIILLYSLTAKQKYLLWPIVIIFAISIWQIAWQFSSNYGQGFSYAIAGWILDKNSGIWIYWLRSFGLLFVFMPFSLWVIKKREMPIRIALYLGILIWIACNVRSFQPNEWDNIKFMQYSYLFICYPLADFLINNRIMAYLMVPSIAIVFIQTLSGIASINTDFQPGSQILSGKDIAFGKDMRELIPDDAWCISGDYHNNPLVMVGGRKIVMGYPGWLWSYGYNTNSMQDDVKKAYEGLGAEAIKSIRKLGADYLIIGSSEKGNYKINKELFSHFPLLYDKNGKQVYLVDEASRLRVEKILK